MIVCVCVREESERECVCMYESVVHYVFIKWTVPRAVTLHHSFTMKHSVCVCARERAEFNHLPNEN